MPSLPMVSICATWSVLCAVCSGALAQPVVTPAISTFELGCEGWTGNLTGLCDEDGTPSVGISWITDGTIQFNEGTSVEAPDTTIVAPEQFLGDWSALSGTGSIQFDHRVVNSGSNNGLGPREIYISGPAGSATWTGPTPPNGDFLSSSWETFTARLIESEWAVVGVWPDLLSDVDSLEIRVDHYSSFVGSAETSRFDNIRIINCTGDFNGNNKVDLNDLQSLLFNFGTTSDSPADCDGDGDSDLDDLQILLFNFGRGC